MSQSALDFLAEGDALFRVGRYVEAESCYRQGCALDDANADLWCNLGAATLRLGRYVAAREAFTRALEIQPDNTAALNNLAVLLGSMGQAEESLARFLALSELAPNDPDVLGNIGSTLIKLKRFSEVRPWFERALAMAPGHPAATQGLARVMQEYGEEENARSLVENFLANYPDTGIVHLIRASMALPVFAATIEESQRAAPDFSEQIDRLIAWLGEKPRHEFGKLVGDSWPFELAYRPGNHREVLSRWGDCMATQGKSYQAVLGTYPAQVNGRSKIRLAILCEQVRRHSVWDVILKGIVQHIDRQQFELVIYHTGRDTDQETAWAEAQVDRFVQGPKGHAEWLQVICADAPDVLLYPEIGMDNLTCKLATLRLAPLQVVSWGHPITTGLPDVDLFLSGELIESPDAEAHYREKLIRLPGTGACTEMFPCDPVPLPAELQALLPKSSDIVKFLICQRPLKMDPADDALLAQIIATTQPCKLFLLRDLQYPWANERIRARLAAALRCEGVNPDEVLVELPWLAREHFFTLLDTMDVYLDMPSFSGYTTAWQAIHRGMPIVTLEGEFMRQRLAAGLLRKIEQTETIAQSEAEYIDIATRLAEECRDAELRAKRRAAIKTAAPKADHDVSVVRMFEQILLDELIQHHITLNPNKDEDMKKEKSQVINITKNLQQRYIELLKNTLLNEVYLENEVRFLYIFAMLSIGKNVDINTVREINKVLPEWVKSIREARQEGRPWWSLTLTDGKGGQKILNLRNVVEFSHTMVGRKRLDNIAHCLDIIRLENIPGDVIETGAWRGGASIFMKGYLSCYEMNDRKVWVADSFEGLPIPSLPEDAGYDFSASKQPILAVSLEEVQENFHRYDLLDENVKFLKGWFCDTLPTAPIEQLAVLRLDGDLYESTMDALNALYHKVVVGGFVIVDDYNDFEPCRRAITEFREKHKIIDPIRKIDWTGVFWRKS